MTSWRRRPSMRLCRCIICKQRRPWSLFFDGSCDLYIGCMVKSKGRVPLVCLYFHPRHWDLPERDLFTSVFTRNSSHQKKLNRDIRTPSFLFTIQDFLVKKGTPSLQATAARTKTNQPPTVKSTRP